MLHLRYPHYAPGYHQRAKVKYMEFSKTLRVNGVVSMDDAETAQYEFRFGMVHGRLSEDI